MNSAIQNNLTKVPETMLIPLRARYNETKRPHGIIRDPKSVEILDRIEPFFEGRREVSRKWEWLCVRIFWIASPCNS